MSVDELFIIRIDFQEYFDLYYLPEKLLKQKY